MTVEVIEDELLWGMQKVAESDQAFSLNVTRITAEFLEGHISSEQELRIDINGLMRGAIERIKQAEGTSND